MNNRKNEFKKIKKHELYSNWFLILLISIIFVIWFLIIYMVSIFESQYSKDSTFKIVNDIIVSIFTGLISGILSIILAFIFLDLSKRANIKDYFSYYSYLNSLRNKSKFAFFKDSKIPQNLYNKNSNQLTKTEFITLVANILNYTIASPQYKNLLNEIESDFAIHAFLRPNFAKQRKIAIIRIISIDILIPIFIMSILIFSIWFLYYKKNEKTYPISALVRILIIFTANIFSLSVSISIYEFYILNSVKNYNTFNDFYFLSFNNFQFKFLNSSLIRK
ncbi:hypothetical protein [Metamycoplasma canadense]|nr:hypothetical protein [Metamycoplasma canadense]